MRRLPALIRLSGGLRRSGWTLLPSCGKRLLLEHGIPSGTGTDIFPREEISGNIGKNPFLSLRVVFAGRVRLSFLFSAGCVDFPGFRRKSPDRSRRTVNLDGAAGGIRTCFRFSASGRADEQIAEWRFLPEPLRKSILPGPDAPVPCRGGVPPRCPLFLQEKADHLFLSGREKMLHRLARASSISSVVRYFRGKRCFPSLPWKNENA